MEKTKTKDLTTFSDKEVVDIYEAMELRLLNMEQLTEEESNLWNALVAELFRRDILV